VNYKILGAFKLVDFYHADLDVRHADNQLYARVNAGFHDSAALDAMEAHYAHNEFIMTLSTVGDVQPVKVTAGVRVQIVGVVS
jgi:hypothetical protein